MSDASELGTVHPERAMFLHVAYGSGKTSMGEPFELSTDVSGFPLVYYRHRYFSISWQEIVSLALPAIDAALASAGGES